MKDFENIDPAEQESQSAVSETEEVDDTPLSEEASVTDEGSDDGRNLKPDTADTSGTVLEVREFTPHKLSIPSPERGAGKAEPVQSEKSGGRGSLALVIILILLALFSIGLRAGRDGFPVASAQGVVAIINVSGPIEFSGSGSDGLSFLGSSGAGSIIRQLDQVASMEQVKAVVLRVNSPGGTVGSAQEICRHVDSIRESGKKVIASMGDVAASGGYYVCTGADRIFANPGTLTGSIGVIMGGFEASTLLDKLGVQDNTVTSGEFKDIGSMYRPMKDSEKILIKAMVDDCCDQFLQRIRERRNLTPEQIAVFSDGRVMTGRQAKQNGLVDEMGGLREAVNSAAALAGIKGEPRIFNIKDSGLDLLFRRLSSSTGRYLSGSWLGRGLSSWLKLDMERGK